MSSVPFRITAMVFTLLILFCFGPIQATILTFDDEGDFLTAAGTVSVESFESSSGTNLLALTTPSFQLDHSSGFSVLNSPSPFGTFATDGVRFLEELTVQPNEFRFHNFVSPLRAFGLFITDYGDFGSAPLTLTINNSQTIVIATTGGLDGNLRYFGVVANAGEEIIDIRLTSDDAIGIDEVSFSSAVPEPSSFLLLGVAVLLMARKR